MSDLPVWSYVWLCIAYNRLVVRYMSALAMLWAELRWFLRVVFFFFKQKTAYEMRISDWSSDVCSSDLSLEELRRLLDQAHHGEGVGQPEAADEERALRTLQPVRGPFGAVTQDQAIFDQVAPDRFDSAGNARIGRRQEAGQRHQKQRSVQLRPAVMLDEGLLLLAPAL